MKQEIKLTLTIDETNLILEGLGSMPFNKVYGLIAKIQEQASVQLRQEGSAEAAGDEAQTDSPVRAVKE